jgi:hypothetical protein
MTVTIEDRFKLRRGTAANLTAVNETPLDGEICYEKDTGKFKVGDGLTPYLSLPYFSVLDTVLRVRLATAAALPASTYANGTAGVGATITITATGTLSVDGVVAALGDFLLVTDEATSARNGVYKVTTAGAVGVAAVLMRAIRADASDEVAGRLVTVGPEGTANANTVWQCTSAASPTIGTTAITFSRVGSGGIGGSQFAVAGGTSDAITAAFVSAPILADGLELRIRATAANATTTPTFNPNGLGALIIYKLGGGTLLVEDISGPGHELILRYRASPARYELLNPRNRVTLTPGANVTVDNSNPYAPVVASIAAGIGLKGRLAAYANLPSSGNSSGDAYVLDSDSMIYVWNGSTWPSSGAGINSGGGLVRLSKQVVATATATISFSSIPAGYSSLKIVLTGRDTNSASGELATFLQINGDGTAANYTLTQGIQGISSTTGAGAGAALVIGSTTSGGCVGSIPGTSGLATAVGSSEILIPNYAGTAFHKIVRTSYSDFYGSSTPSRDTAEVSFLWKSTAAIDSLVLVAGGTSFAVGTTAVLYAML